jgi:hypothetical protein
MLISSAADQSFYQLIPVVALCHVSIKYLKYQQDNYPDGRFIHKASKRKR